MIKICNLSKTSRHQSVLDNIQLEILNEKIIGLVGQNGVGKSTLLQAIAGRLTISTHVLYEGQPVRHNVHAAQHIFLLSQQPTFSDHFNLAQILQYGNDVFPHFNWVQANHLLQQVKLQPSYFYYELSKGQAAIFSFIYALCTRATYTLLDEPLDGVDEISRKQLYEILLKDYIQHPRTFVIASHHLQEIEHLLEELIILKQHTIYLHENIHILQQRFVKVSHQHPLQHQYPVIYMEEHPIQSFSIIDLQHKDWLETWAYETLDLHEIYYYISKGALQ